MKCVCQSSEDVPPFFHEPYAEFANAQRIVLFDTETFSGLESLNVVLLDDYTRDILAGEQVVVTGSVQKVTRGGKTLSYLYVGLNPINGVDKFLEHVDRKESVVLKDGDEKKIRDRIAQNKGKEIESLVAPRIIGEKHLKKDLIMAYINSGKDPVSKRRRLDYGLHQFRQRSCLKKT